MKIAVYDTYYTAAAGQRMHFDVLVEDGVTPEKALEYARNWLDSIGEKGSGLKQERCTYCHSENAPEPLKQIIEKDGCYILQMENCPNPEV
ncbi:MAG: DUF2024 family protein [Alphaproteobacteria bacterium]|nr:DUF2024 family protein [Alphaproteobacteria bacterium]